MVKKKKKEIRVPPPSKIYLPTDIIKITNDKTPISSVEEFVEEKIAKVKKSLNNLKIEKKMNDKALDLE